MCYLIIYILGVLASNIVLRLLLKSNHHSKRLFFLSLFSWIVFFLVSLGELEERKKQYRDLRKIKR